MSANPIPSYNYNSIINNLLGGTLDASSTQKLDVGALLPSTLSRLPPEVRSEVSHLFNSLFDDNSPNSTTNKGAASGRRVNLSPAELNLTVPDARQLANDLATRSLGIDVDVSGMLDGDVTAEDIGKFSMSAMQHFGAGPPGVVANAVFGVVNGDMTVEQTLARTGYQFGFERCARSRRDCRRYAIW